MISAIVTRGYAIGTIALVVTRGYAIGEELEPPVGGGGETNGVIAVAVTVTGERI